MQRIVNHIVYNIGDRQDPFFIIHLETLNTSFDVKVKADEIVTACNEVESYLVDFPCISDIESNGIVHHHLYCNEQYTDEDMIISYTVSYYDERNTRFECALHYKKGA